MSALSSCTELDADDPLASRLHHLVRVSQPLQSDLPRLWVDTSVALLLLVCVSQVKDLRLVSKVVLPVGVTVKLFLWMRQGLVGPWPTASR